jgi:hypothetical protein
VSVKISLLLPTRKRPLLANRFLQSAARCADRAELVEAIVYVDEDDVDSYDVNCGALTCKTIIGPRLTMGGYNTGCFQQSGGDIVVLTNDDVMVRTKGWDSRLRALHERFTDGVYLLYPNDLFKGKGLCAFPILSRRTCEVLGNPFPPAYRGSFIDYHLLDIFKRLERRGYPRLLYLEDVIFEHMHHRTGKNVYDETYRQRRRFADDSTFLALRNERSRATERLASEIAGTARCAALQTYPAPKPGSDESLADRFLAIVRCIGPDRELPLGWRTFLFVWFVGRLLAAGGYLPGVRAGDDPV